MARNEKRYAYTKNIGHRYRVFGAYTQHGYIYREGGGRNITLSLTSLDLDVVVSFAPLGQSGFSSEVRQVPAA